MMRRWLPAQLLYPGCPVNWQAPLNNGLEGWWKVLPLWTGANQWRDLVGQNPAALTGMATNSATSGWGTTKRQGGWGELRFDGTDDAAEVLAPTSTLALGPGDLTVAAWIFPTAIGAYQTIVEKWSGGGGREYGYFLVDSTGSQLYFEQGATATTVNLSPVFVTQAWQHFVARRRGTALSVWRNGRLVGSGVGAGVATGTAVLRFGSAIAGQGTTRWNGKLDDIRIYSRALADGEIPLLYHASLQHYPQELTWQPWPPAWPAGAPRGLAPPPRRTALRFYRRAS